MPWYRVVHFGIMAVGLLAGIIHFRRLTAGSRWLLWLLVLTIVTEAAAWSMSVWGNGNLLIYHFFIVVQFGLFSQAYRDELSQLRRLITGSQLLMVGAGVWNLIVNREHLYEVYPSFLRTVFNVLVILFCLLYLRELLKRQTDYSFNQYPLFWLSLGWLIFSVITLFNFSAFNYLAVSTEKAELLFRSIRVSANFMLYSMFIFALLSKQRRIGHAPLYDAHR